MFSMSVYINDYCRYAWQLLTGSRFKGELDIAGRRQRDIAPYINCQDSLRILDLANGRLRPQYTILKARGHKVCGIDRVNRSSLNWINIAYCLARELYAWKLNSVVGRRNGRTLVCGDVSILPFKQNTFDLVTSVAAFEHFLDVPSVIAEVKRILRPGGVAWVGIHPFTCLSGGHNLSLAEFPLHRVPKGVDAWDHLRRRRLPFHVPLNEWRPGQYLEEFIKHFEVLKHYCATREGEAILTPGLEAELSGYSRDELTCGAYIIVARRPYL